MGWLWASPPSTAKGGNGSASGSSGSTQNTTTNNNNSNNNNNNTSSNNKPAEPAANANDDHGDPELAKFMAEIQAQFGGGSGSSSHNNKPNPATSTSSPGPDNNNNNTSSSSPSWSSLWTTSSQSPSQPQPPTPTPLLDPLTESLLPTRMSCQQAFDAAFHCNSLGGQWTSVYRSGAVRSCAPLWDEFWFCMRARAYAGGAVKEAAVRDYYRRREVERYGPGRPSSTDVWEARAERLPPGAAFAVPYEAPDLSDEDWRRLEIERRRRVRESLDRDEEEKEHERAPQ